MYPAVWTLLRSPRDRSAIWFDFGGLSSGTADSGGDPLAGISEFKRNFGGEDLIVGEKWSLDAAPLRQRLIQSFRRQLASLMPHRGRVVARAGAITPPRTAVAMVAVVSAQLAGAGCGTSLGAWRHKGLSVAISAQYSANAVRKPQNITDSRTWQYQPK